MQYLPWGYRTPVQPLIIPEMVRANSNLPGRTKPTLPLTRTFVPPKRIEPNKNIPQRKEEIPTSSLTPVEDEEEEEEDDEEERLEEKKVEILLDKGKGKMMDIDLPRGIEPSGQSISSAQVDKEVSANQDNSSNVLKTVQELMEEYTVRQEQFDSFMNEATASITKLERRITEGQTQYEDDEKCKEDLRELKALMADAVTQRAVPIVGIESAGSFGDFNDQQARTQSHLSRFTQLDSDDESTSLQQTIDPKVLRPSYQVVQPGTSPPSSPDPPSSAVLPRSPPREQVRSPDYRFGPLVPSSPTTEQADFPASTPSPPVHTGTTGDMLAPDQDTSLVDIPPFSSPLLIPSPNSSPYQPSSSAAAAASSLISIAHSEYHASSPPPPSTPEATQPFRPSPSPPPLTQSVQSTKAIHHLADQAVKTTGSTKRSRRQTTTPAVASSSPFPPPPKRLKSRKTVSKDSAKPKTKKKRSTGESGSLPLGTLGRSKGVKRVLGANWPKIGPNTVVGLAGNIECEQVRLDILQVERRS
jgi:hypothetical protein